jgi:hypothetical protein
MKLYNIFKSVILEEQKQLLTENVRDEILKAIDSKYNLWFKYKDDDNTVTDRYVQIYDLGMSANNNEMISAYQLGGNIKPSKVGNKAYGWKQFRLDKIIDGSIKPVRVTYKQPVSDLPSYGAGPKFNPSGNKNMRGNITKVNFNEK